MKVECDDWYRRKLDSEERDDGLKWINAEKRLALVEEELHKQSEELKKLKKGQSNPVPKNIGGKYY